jgi:predicted metalloprotease with PDZ domain
LMQKLTDEYGVSKPFNDNELFTKITALTYPEVGAFLETYVAGTTPIPYDNYFAKVGLSRSSIQSPTNVFLKDQKPYITVNPQTKEIIVIPNIELNDFYTSLGLKGGDVILAINDKGYTLENIYDMIGSSETWKENDAITVQIKRDGTTETIKGKVKLPYEEKQVLKATDISKKQLKEAWLKA